MIILRMTHDYPPYVSGRVYAFQDAEGVALFNGGYGVSCSGSCLPTEVPDGAITTVNGDFIILTMDGDYILTVNGAVPL